MPRVVQVDPIDCRALRRVNSLSGTDFFQQRVRVRQVNLGHVLHERAHHFVVPNSPVDPTNEHHQLHQGREGHGPPIRVIDNANYFGQRAVPTMNSISRSADLVRAREGNVFREQPQICFAVTRCRRGAACCACLPAGPLKREQLITRGAYSPVRTAPASNSLGFSRGSAFLYQIDSNEVDGKACRQYDAR
jgi:hypothetical protein